MNELASHRYFIWKQSPVVLLLPQVMQLGFLDQQDYVLESSGTHCSLVVRVENIGVHIDVIGVPIANTKSSNTKHSIPSPITFSSVLSR